MLNPRFSVELGDTELSVAVRSGSTGSWWMGFAETGVDARNAWTGEDCYQGDRVGGEVVLYCHRLSGTEGRFTYGGSRGALSPSTETALTGPDDVGELTFYFVDVLSGVCWSGGDDPDYYADVCSRVVTISQSR